MITWLIIKLLKYSIKSMRFMFKLMICIMLAPIWFIIGFMKGK